MPAVSRQAYAEIVAVSLHLIHKLKGERDGGGREGGTGSSVGF